MVTHGSERIRRNRGRSGGVLLVLVLVLLAAGPSGAEVDLGPVRLSGDAEFGGRLVWGDTSSAKFQEYRDIQDGVIGGLDLLLESDDIRYWLRARGENVGYGDQRYWLEGGLYGRFEIDLFYGELPHFLSRVSETPYDQGPQGKFRLPLTDAERDAIEAAGTIAPGDLPFMRKKLDQRWREGSIGAKYHAGESVLLRTSFRVQDKQGNRPFGQGFGTPGGSFVNLPAPVDNRTYEARAGVDWTLGSSTFTAEYLGSFFQNDVKPIVGDNPLVSPATITTDPDQGRSADYPDNWAQSLALSGATSLPLGVPNTFSANFAYGFRYQDDGFLPHTINPRIVDPPLPESSLDGQVQTLLGNVLGTIQIVEDLRAKLSYRIYDFNNLTDPITFDEWVLNDTNEESNPLTSIANDYTRQNADLDLAWDFAHSWTGVVGFGWENWDRSSDREVRRLNEYGPNLKLDYRDGTTLVHAGYEFRARDGSSYRPYAPIEAGTDLMCPDTGPSDDCGAVKFASMRKFDEADLYLNRFDVLARFQPAEPLELTFTGGFDYLDYNESKFGLVSSLGWSVGTDAFYQIHERVGLTAYYTYQWQKYRQKSRYRPRNFGPPPIVVVDDPANDWKSSTEYGYHNAGAILRVALLPKVLDADFEYLINYGQEKTRSSGKPGGAGAGDAVDYPKIHDTLQAVGATLSWHLNEMVTFSASYRFENYDLTNFRFQNIPTDFTDGDNVYLRGIYGDYSANVFAMRASVHF